MRSVLFAVLMFFGLSASAQDLEIPCKFEDYQLINAALSSDAVNGDYRRVTQLKKVLMYERGPVCKQLISSFPQVGIPEYTTKRYKVVHGVDKFEIVINLLKLQDDRIANVNVR